MTRAIVIGGSGYTGAELLRLLAAHPVLEAVQVTASSNAGERVDSLYPSLTPAYRDLVYEPYAPHSIDEGVEVAFVALPHGESQRHMTGLVEQVEHVIDLGADFRLPAGVYQDWYGQEHQAPDLIDRFAFGLPELFRSEIRDFDHVANPGCYPTAAALALAPAMAFGLAAPEGIVVDAISGLSGRGRSVSADNLFSENDGSVSAYGLLDHRHTAEMELALGAVSGEPVQVLFTPHVAPMTRGLLSTCYAEPAADGLTTESLLARYREFYESEPFVQVVDEPPPTKATATGNSVFVTARFDTRTGTIVAIAAEDNLVKGAAGQAIQNANLVLGLDEAAGLVAAGVMP